MGKEIKIGLAVIGVLLIIFSTILVRRIIDTESDSPEKGPDVVLAPDETKESDGYDRSDKSTGGIVSVAGEQGLDDDLQNGDNLPFSQVPNARDPWVGDSETVEVPSNETGEA